MEDYDSEDYDYFKEWDIEQYEKEIDRLKSLWKTDKENWNEIMAEKEQEVERLNNNWNELEKWLDIEIIRIQEIDKKSKVKRYGIEQQLDECAINRYMQVKDKIKELKGSDKE